jgi:hypothetical protein
VNCKVFRDTERDRSQSGASLCVAEGTTGVVHIGSSLALSEGTVQDLVTPAGRVSPEDQVALGHRIRVKVTSCPNNRVRVDMNIQHTEVQTAGQDGIVVAGNTFRVVQKAQLGQAVSVTLEKGDHAAARTRVEFQVTQQTR